MGDYEKLELAIKSKNKTESLEKLLKPKFFNFMNVDVNAKDINGWTALILASNKGLKGMVKILLEKGADINLVNCQGKSALHYAVLKKRPSLVKYLIDQGADVNLKDNDGCTPFHYSFFEFQYENSDVLISNGADINETTDEGKGALHYSMTDIITIERFDYLLSKGANPNIADEQNKTPIFYATSIETLETLINTGANIEHRDCSKITPLINSLYNKYPTLAIHLIKVGANPNVIDGYGKTPLHLAVKEEYIDIVEVLVSKGVLLDVKDNYFEYTPLDYAVDSENEEIIKILTEAGAKKS